MKINVWYSLLLLSVFVTSFMLSRGMALMFGSTKKKSSANPHSLHGKLHESSPSSSTSEKTVEEKEGKSTLSSIFDSFSQGSSKVISKEPARSKHYDADLEYDFADTAIVTMCAGDVAARQAIPLMQSLRDVNTRVPNIIVMLSRGGIGSADCNSGEVKKARNREGRLCQAPDAVDWEIISQEYLDTFHKLGVQTMVIEEIPSTPFTMHISGGRSLFWGMALNKLTVFNMTQFKRVMWMDGDVFAFKNFDHLFAQADDRFFEGSITYGCCNPNAPGIPSGGMWVFKPSLEVGTKLWDMMAKGKPIYERTDPNDPSTLQFVKYDTWPWGDMEIVRYLFSDWERKFDQKFIEPYWPRVDDDRHGWAVGADVFAPVDPSLEKVKGLRAGFMAEKHDNKSIVWRAMNVSYDQCVGQCECLPHRDHPEIFFTVHFSCLQSMDKPGSFLSEEAFLTKLYENTLSCTRWNFMRWYDAFKRAHGRLPAPLYTGLEMPEYDAAHDEVVKANRIRAKAQQ
jgi:hypothetical protein